MPPCLFGKPRSGLGCLLCHVCSSMWKDVDRLSQELQRCSRHWICWGLDGPQFLLCARRGRGDQGQCVRHWVVCFSLGDWCIVCSCGKTHRTSLTHVQNNQQPTTPQTPHNPSTPTHTTPAHPHTQHTSQHTPTHPNTPNRTQQNPTTHTKHTKHSNKNNNKQQQQQQQASIPSVPSLCVFPPFTKDLSEQPRTGAAQRRRQRLLRSWRQHEQQSIAAALATSLHHSSRGQRKATAGEEESETKYTAKFRTTPPPQPVLFSPARLRARREAACRPGRAAGATGAGSEAHHGAHRRPCGCCSHGADPRRSCAADSGTAARHPVREPQLVEQLVEVSLDRVVIAGGACRFRATPQWDHPEGYTARVGRCRNTGQG